MTTTKTKTKSLSQILADNVVTLRTQHNATQEELAEAADIGVRHVQRIEAGEANPKLDTLGRLATALSTTAAALITRHF